MALIFLIGKVKKFMSPRYGTREEEMGMIVRGMI